MLLSERGLSPESCLAICHLRSSIVWTSPPPPVFLKGGSKFWLPPLDGGIWKIKKRGWKYGVGAGLLKRGAWHFSYLSFWRFVIFTIPFTLCKITLPFAKSCYPFEEKLFFSATIILWQKVILSYLKMNLKIFHKLIQLICERILENDIWTRKITLLIFV